MLSRCNLCGMRGSPTAYSRSTVSHLTIRQAGVLSVGGRHIGARCRAGVEVGVCVATHLGLGLVTTCADALLMLPGPGLPCTAAWSRCSTSRLSSMFDLQCKTSSSRNPGEFVLSRMQCTFMQRASYAASSSYMNGCNKQPLLRCTACAYAAASMLWVQEPHAACRQMCPLCMQ